MIKKGDNIYVRGKDGAPGAAGDALGAFAGSAVGGAARMGPGQCPCGRLQRGQRGQLCPALRADL